MKTLILTGCDAAMKRVGDISAPNIHAYARRHGYDFERISEYPGDCHPSWHKLQIVIDRINDDRLGMPDRIAWFDADVVITRPDQSLDFCKHRQAAIHVSRDWTDCEPEKIQHFSFGNFILDLSTKGKRAAVEGLFRKAQQKTQWKNAPLWEQQAMQELYVEDEDARSLFAIHPRRTFNAVPALPSTSGPEPWQPGDFLAHLTFISMDEREQLLPEYVMAGIKSLVPDLPEWHEPSMCADIRHIAAIRDLLMSGLFSKALEVGVWTGASAAAFCAALDHRVIDRYHACDVGLQKQFFDVIGNREVCLHQKASVECLADERHQWDVIFLDGDHSLETGKQEIELVLAKNPRCVILHDVCSTAVGYPGCEGPRYMHEKLVAEGWRCVVDNLDRPGERTNRGLLMAAKDCEAISAIKHAFELNCY